MTHVQNPIHFPPLSEIREPEIAAEVWRNHIAMEIQSDPEQYTRNHGIDIEAEAIAAGQLARRDFNDEPETEPEAAEFTTEEAQAVAADMRSALLVWITCLSLAAFFGFITWAAWVSA
ncbi:hypothetical protein [Rhodococcus erythropolis]|uniref:Uncharacterized protein n=1 Tax=Rhodococcus erythropolis (strain PR4 / NBRC 100887) TaxID=234621 RepID=C0ZXB7_RHOE4|nr:hypothetical protein [Rhodococcus erythropolis]BAH33002.1 hypothetical protein RER_22940 [Rhodococcus erythropolis PR4]